MVVRKRCVVTIGSDPEFGFIHRIAEEQVRACSLPFSFRTNSGNIGLDGHSDIAEIRANYGYHPREHTANIQRLLQSLTSKMDRYSALSTLAGSYIFEKGSGGHGDAIGGHIHFGAQGPDATHCLKEHRSVIADELNYWFAPAVTLIEQPKTALLRRETGYGRLGDWRLQPHGLEYRTCGSWLVSPGAAYAVLSLAYLVVDAVVNEHVPTRPSIFNYRAMERALTTMNRPQLLAHYYKIKPILSQFPLIQMNDKEIAGGIGYLNHLITQGLMWREATDMRILWKTVNPANLGVIDSASTRTPDAAHIRAQYSGRYTPLRWPGPGLPGHALFAAIFNNGHRYLIFNQQPIFIMVDPSLHARTGNHVALSFPLSGQMERLLQRGGIMNPRVGSSFRPGIFPSDVQVHYCIFDEAIFERICHSFQERSRSGRASWSVRLFRTLNDVLSRSFVNINYRFDAETNQLVHQVEPSQLVQECDILQPPHHLPDCFRSFVWHHSQLANTPPNEEQDEQRDEQTDDDANQRDDAAVYTMTGMLWRLVNR